MILSDKLHRHTELLFENSVALFSGIKEGLTTASPSVVKESSSHQGQRVRLQSDAESLQSN